MKNFRNILQYIDKTSKFIDYPLLVTYIILSSIGLMMICSASMVPTTKDTLTGGIDVPETYFYNRRLAYVIISSIVIFFIAFLVNVKLLSNIKMQKDMVITIVSLLLLTLVISKDINSSRSWISLGFMNLQVSELLKIAIVLYIPFMISRKMPRVLSKPKLILSSIVLVLGCTFLVFLQKDTGRTLLILIILIAIIFYLGIGVNKVLGFGVPVVLGLLIVFVIALIAGQLPSYLTARFSTLTDSFQFESGTGYHISNSLLAIGSGGVFRKGLENNAVKLGYLPEPHTDFIFIIVCEELGLIGGLLVITLEFSIVYRAFQFANEISSYFYEPMCVRIAIYFGSQTSVNIDGIPATIPLAGMPLSSISFSGLSVVSLSIAMGLLLIVDKQIRVNQQREKQRQKVDIRRQFN